MSSSSEESGDCASEEDELDRVDTMPVRDTSCQTSIDKLMLKHKSKSGSPEKTNRKVMTVKYLLGELKALVANQGEWSEIAASAISVPQCFCQTAKQTGYRLTSCVPDSLTVCFTDSLSKSLTPTSSTK